MIVDWLLAGAGLAVAVAGIAYALWCLLFDPPAKSKKRKAERAGFPVSAFQSQLSLRRRTDPLPDRLRFGDDWLIVETRPRPR